MILLDLVGLEWRRLRRDAMFWAATALSCLAIWYGLANGAAWMRFQEQAIARSGVIAEEGLASAKAEALRLAAIPGSGIGSWSDPRNPAGFEGRFLHLYDCMKPTPLAMVAVGQSDLLPYCLRVGAGPLSYYAANHEWENPLRLLLGRFDATFAIITLLPLLVLAASFNLLSRERELGTLPLILSYPVPLSRWLGVCFLLRVLVFVGLVIGALILGLIAVGFDASAPGAIARLALYLAMTAAYLGFWFAAAWLVNARGGSSAGHALVLASLWIALVILAPAGLNLAFVDAVRQASDASTRKASTLLADYFHDHPELARGATSRAQFGSRRLAVNMATEAAVRPELDRFRGSNESQQGLIDRLRYLSPALLFQQAANALSGNDSARHRQFLDVVEAHRAEGRRFFAPAFVSDAAFTGFDEVPSFTHRDDQVGIVVKDASVGILLLLVSIAFLSIGGAIALRRPPLER